MTPGRVWLEIDLDDPPAEPRTALDARIDEPRTDNAMALVERLVRDRGAQAPAQLTGDFAFAAWDPVHRRLIAARDRFGLRSLYWARRGRRVAFSTSFKDLHDLEWIDRDLDETRAVELLLGWPASADATLARGIRLVAPATSVTITREASATARYWDPRDAPDLPRMSDADYAQGLREVLATAVRDRLRGLPPGASGATLSGGLDSSPIAVLARDAAREHSPTTPPPPYPVYARVYPSMPGTDEAHWVQRVTDLGGFAPHLLPPDAASTDPNQPDGGDPASLVPPGEQPLWVPHAPFHAGLARAASRDGVTALLFGESGDEVVGHGVARLQELARSARPLELWRAARTVGRYYGFSMPAVFRQYVLAPLPPPRLRRAWMERRYGGWPFFASALPVRADAAHRLRLKDHFWTAAEQPELRLPRSMREDRFHRWMSPDRSIGSSMADRLYRHFGIEQQHPFSDLRVLEYCMGLPPEQSLNRGLTRAVARRAFDGLIPHDVAWRGTKSDLEPAFYGWARSHVEAWWRDVQDPGHPAWEWLDRAPALARMERQGIGAHGPAGSFFDLWRLVTLGRWLKREWGGRA